MKKLITIIPLLISATLFTSCASSSDSAKPTVVASSNALPSWYTQAPENDQRFIYGIGQGESRKLAISQALNDAVSTLNVSVSSRFSHSTSSVTQDGREDVSKESLDEVEIATKKLTLNNYEIVEQEHLANNTDIVMIRIHKYELYESLHEDIENSFKMLNASIQNKSDELELILIYRTYMGIIKQKMQTIGILKSLNPAFDADEFKTALKSVIETHNKLIENKVFKLVIDDPYKTYTATIRKRLMRDGVKVTTADDYDYFINVTIEEQSKVAVRRQVITFLTTNISVGIGDNRSNKDIFFSTVALKSESDVSIEDARDKINEQLKKRIKEGTVFSHVGN